MNKILTKESKFYLEPILSPSCSLYLDSKGPVDKIRVSFCITNALNNHVLPPGVLVWSSLINDFIGSSCYDFVEFNAGPLYNGKIEPNEGIEIFFSKKIALQSSYQFKFYYLDGSAINMADFAGGDFDFNILFEFFSLE